MADPSPEDVRIEGLRLGRYEVVRRLAAGGMGEIFLARATGIGGFAKSVALKRLRPELAADPAFVAMFLDEARIAATLDHSNIVQVSDVLLEEGTVWIVMEYLRGADVAQLVKQFAERSERLPVGSAVAIAIAVADALHYAHERCDDAGQPLEIVHRDVSPGNVQVTLDGTVKVIDFGIARANARTTETRVGTIKGKLQFMSPEQCRGERLDRRSDVFSLGVSLYEMLTGRLPHEGADEYEIQKAIVEGPILAPSRIAPTIPPDIDAIVTKCLAKRPTERHATAGALAASLLRAAEQHRWDLSPFALARLVKSVQGVSEAPHEPPHRSSISVDSAYLREASTRHEALAATSSPALPLDPPTLPRGRTIAAWSVLPIAAIAAAAGAMFGGSSASPSASPSALPAGPTLVASSTPTQASLASASPREAAVETVEAAPPTSPASSVTSAPTAPSTVLSRTRTSSSVRPPTSPARPPPDPDAPLPR